LYPFNVFASNPLPINAFTLALCSANSYIR
jgi:hypothetical protein